MINAYLKAKELREKYSEADAICQATQCLVLATGKNKDYWWDVVENIKYYGR